MRSDAKLGLFVFLVLVISVFFLVAHELSQRPVEDASGDEATSAAEVGTTLPTIDGSEPAPWADLPAVPAVPAVPAATAAASASSADAWHALPEVRAPESAQAQPDAGEYVVESGDNLWVISKKVYGKGSQWRRIFEANRDRLGSPDAVLKVGMKLEIPPGDASPTVRPSAPAGEAPWGSELADASGRTHVVESGESLYTIAKKYYGSGAKEKTDLIYAANRERLSNPEMLKVGMTLSIPETRSGR